MESVSAYEEVIGGTAAIGRADRDSAAVVSYVGHSFAIADPGAGLLGAVPEDGSQVRPVHSQRCRKILSTGPDILQDCDDCAGGVGGAQSKGAEGVPFSPHLIPNTEVAEDSQGVALKRDPGTQCLRLRGLFKDLHLDACLGQEDGGGQPRSSRSDDSDPLYCCHLKTPLC